MQRIIEYRAADPFQLKFILWMQRETSDVSLPPSGGFEDVDTLFAYLMKSHSWFSTPLGTEVRMPLLSDVFDCNTGESHWEPHWIDVTINDDETFAWWKGKEAEWVLRGESADD